MTNTILEFKMDNYLKAYNMGRQQAVRNFDKTASAKDVAMILKELGAMGKGALGLVGSGAKGTGKALKNIQQGGKMLGTQMDPRLALLAGLGTAGLALGAPAIAAGVKEGVGSGALKGLAALTGAGGAMLAGSANPGLIGGSVPNRMAHEIAMSARTPAGLVGAMAGLVGLPAALIAYGKAKGREESNPLSNLF